MSSSMRMHVWSMRPEDEGQPREHDGPPRIEIEKKGDLMPKMRLSV
jgi:hypothetical protein